MHLSLREGQTVDRNQVIRRLLEIQYERNDIDFHRSTFRVKGDVLDIFPSNSSQVAIRVEFFGDEIERISEFDPTSSHTLSDLSHVAIFPATHYAVGNEKLKKALSEIAQDCELVEAEFKKQEKFVEAQRIRERVNYDNLAIAVASKTIQDILTAENQVNHHLHLWTISQTTF